MTVGANIISIITESLYDKPVVVFREYVQNSIDAFSKRGQILENCAVDICIKARNTDVTKNDANEILDIFFLDNGTGIEYEDFEGKMINIASSGKRKYRDMGYKGIGRLSGISYCERLTFINILDWQQQKFQVYSIDCRKFREIKNTDDFLESEAKTAFKLIGTPYNNLEEIHDFDTTYIYAFLIEKSGFFQNRNSGFLVVLEEINQVLKDIIQNKDFLQDLSWLLPVKFQDELYENAKCKNLIQGLSEEKVTDSIPAKGYSIYFTLPGESPVLLKRPITTGLLRDCVFKREFQDEQGNVYAIAFLNFASDRLVINKDNPFSGIRMYIDNMLLCDENELLAVLKNLNLTSHTQNELLQSVKTVGIMLYIVDKVNLSANARRTFIDITNSDAIGFLDLISSFISEIYDVRYALSRFSIALTKSKSDEDKINASRIKAEIALETLAKDEVKITLSENNTTFDELNDTEKKRIIKRIILDNINESIRSYLTLATRFSKETVYKDFIAWLISQNNF